MRCLRPLFLLIGIHAFVALPALKADPANEETKEIEAAFKSQDWDKMISLCDSLIKRNPKNSKAFHCRAFAHNQKKETKLAIADWTEAVRLDPQFGKAFWNRGSLCYVEKDYERAIGDFTKAIELDYQKIMAYVNRAGAYTAAGQNKKALADLDAAIKLDSRCESAFYNRAVIHGNEGDFDKAMENLNRVIELNPKNDVAYAKRGLILLVSNAQEQALADFKECLRLNKANWEAHWGYGSFYASVGDYDKALASFTQAYDLNSEEACVLDSLAKLLGLNSKNKEKDGKRAYELAKRACSASDWKEPKYLQTLARVCGELENFEEAIKWQKQALKLLEKVSDKEWKERAEGQLKSYTEHKPYQEHSGD